MNTECLASVIEYSYLSHDDVDPESVGLDYNELLDYAIIGIISIYLYIYQSIHIYIYIYICVCVCVCVSEGLSIDKLNFA